MDVATKLQGLSERRWLLVPFALAIGFTSAFLLWNAIELAYEEYWLYPMEKAADGYIYPQLRYSFFSGFLILWCLAGLMASGMCLYDAILSRGASSWTSRSIILYLGLFAVLILYGSMMIVARSHGY